MGNVSVKYKVLPFTGRKNYYFIWKIDSSGPKWNYTQNRILDQKNPNLGKYWIIPKFCHFCGNFFDISPNFKSVHSLKELRCNNFKNIVRKVTIWIKYSILWNTISVRFDSSDVLKRGNPQKMAKYLGFLHLLDDFFRV